MTYETRPKGLDRLSTWVSREHWTERIISFNASWFVASMSTGVLVQVLTNCPYQAKWLRDLAYCFWVLCMVMFVFFTTLGVIRSVIYPRLAKATFQDFYQTSYLGAIPVTLDTITGGIVIFYSDRPGAVWAAYGLFWVSVLMSLFVGGIVVFWTCAYQEAPELTSVTGVWLLSFIPCLVTTATGATIIPHLPLEEQGFTIIVCFFLWSLGITMSMVIIVIYFWRLIRHKLPVRDAIVSCFIPMGPTGMGAYGVHTLAIDLSAYIVARDYTLLPATSSTLTPISHATATAAIATSVHWTGILLSLTLVSFSTFWLLQSTLSVVARVPKRFNVGFWSFVFPNGVYANALCLLARDLGNRGFRGWATAMVAVTAALWCLCAAGTLYKGVWRGELFFPPGLEGWNERRALGLDFDDVADDADDKAGGGAGGAKHRDERPGRSSRSRRPGDAEGRSKSGGGGGDAEAPGGELVVTTERTSRADGTYGFSKSTRRKRSLWRRRSSNRRADEGGARLEEV